MSASTPKACLFGKIFGVRTFVNVRTINLGANDFILFLFLGKAVVTPQNNSVPPSKGRTQGSFAQPFCQNKGNLHYSRHICSIKVNFTVLKGLVSVSDVHFHGGAGVYVNACS